jgi:hypothetical protein
MNNQTWHESGDAFLNIDAMEQAFATKVIITAVANTSAEKFEIDLSSIPSISGYVRYLTEILRPDNTIYKIGAGDTISIMLNGELSFRKLLSDIRAVGNDLMFTLVTP